MDARLTDIWTDESTDGLDHLQGVRELEKQAMALEKEHEQTIRRLQEELWDLEDRMSLFDKDRVSGTNDKSSEFEVQSAALQQRRFDLKELSYALEQEQRAEMDLAETQRVQTSIQPDRRREIRNNSYPNSVSLTRTQRLLRPATCH